MLLLARRLDIEHLSASSPSMETLQFGTMTFIPLASAMAGHESLQNDAIRYRVTCRHSSGRLPGQYRPPVSANAGSIRAPFRPPRPVTGVAAPYLGSAPLNGAGLPQHQQVIPSVPARGLGQYSSDMPNESLHLSGGSQQPQHESATPQSTPEHDLDSPWPLQEPKLEQAGPSSAHEAADPPSSAPGAEGVPGVWPAATGQLRAGRAHMRARRRPQVAGHVQQNSQESQPAAENPDAVPENPGQGAGQLQHLRQATAITSITQDQQGGQKFAPEGAAEPEELGSPVESDTLRPQELDTSERDQPGHAPSAPTDRSEAERRRKSQEFIAQITEQARQMRAALHNSTSSSEQRQEGADDAPEDMQADSPGVEAALGQTETEEDEPDIVVDLSSPSPLKPSPAAHLRAPSSTPPVPAQSPINISKPLYVTEQSGLQHSEPESAPLAEGHSSGPELRADLPIDASTSIQASQHKDLQGSQLGVAAVAQAQSRGAGVSAEMPISSTSSPLGVQQGAPQHSQPAREAASPHSDRVGIRLEYRSEVDVSPVRLSLNLDLTASSKQTPPQASAQAAGSDSASPARPLSAASRDAHRPMPRSSAGPSPGMPALDGQAQGSACMLQAGSGDPVHAEHPTPMTAQPAQDAEAMQLSNVPLSALHPRGLFMSQAAEGAPGHPIADLNASPQPIAPQDQPLGLAANPDTSERQELPASSVISARMSQDPVDRHSDHWIAAQPSDQMHDIPRSNSPRGNSQEGGVMNVPSQPLGSPVSMEVDIAEAAESDVQEDQVLLHGTVRGSGSKLYAFRPRSRPPTREELESSMIEQGIPEIQYQGVFYGNPSDVPERPIGTRSRHPLVWQAACAHQP